MCDFLQNAKAVRVVKNSQQHGITKYSKEGKHARCRVLSTLRREAMHNTLVFAIVHLRALLRLCLVACFGFVVGAFAVDSYTPPTIPSATALRAASQSSGRYPVGYDPDNRSRPANMFQASDILNTKPPYPPTGTATRWEEKAKRWTPPVGYHPRRRPPLRRTDTTTDIMQQVKADMTMPQETVLDGSVCPLPDCPLDPRKHICTGIWMGKAIIERRCQKLE